MRAASNFERGKSRFLVLLAEFKDTVPSHALTFDTKSCEDIEEMNLVDEFPEFVNSDKGRAFIREAIESHNAFYASLQLS